MPLSDDLICWSHSRWSYACQRPQQLMARWARVKRVFFVEEPVIDEHMSATGKTSTLCRLDVRTDESGVNVVIPHVAADLTVDERNAAMREAFRTLFVEHGIMRPIAWYDAPTHAEATRDLEAGVVVYDCVRELGSPEERALLSRAHVVFTGGHALYEVNSAWHDNVHVCPSSVDTAHFARARVLEGRPGAEPDDLAPIERPRIGFHGVVDERVDVALVEALARLREEWQFVFVGPIARPMPERHNVHVLGPKSYEALPKYIAGFDVALLPYAVTDDPTRFSPTAKALECMAAGKPIVSTAIPDIVRPYGEIGLVYVGRTLSDFIGSIEDALRDHTNQRCSLYDAFLEGVSWDATFARMHEIVERAACEPKVRLVTERFLAES